MTPKISKALTTIAGAAALATVAIGSQPATAQEAFIGAIEYFAFSFAPRGYALCDGQLLPINQNQSLYSLLGTSFGGDGRTSFALPDMRGRIPVHDGGSAGRGLTRRPLGQKGGVEQVTLSVGQIPSHTHDLGGTSNAGNQTLPAGNTLADDNPDETYRDEAPNADMHAGLIGSSPSQSHGNMPPFLVVSCNIALQGLFPSRN